MRKNFNKKTFITIKTIPIFFAFLTFLFTFLININVSNYGDDYYYMTLVSSDLSVFVNNHISHYLLANGRVIVHLLVSLFLSVDIIFWKIFNSLMLATIVFFGSKISARTYRDKLNKTTDTYAMLFTCVIMFSAIAFLDIKMTRQSVYWLTGSFNYVYPIVMLLIYWYLISNFKMLGKLKFLLPVFAFLSGATVEQISLMAIGLTVITIVDTKFIKKEKVNKLFYIALALSIIGSLSVIFAPATFVRIGLENAEKVPLMQLIQTNIIIQLKSFLYAKYMLPYNILTILASSFCIFKLSSKSGNKYGVYMKIFSIFSVLTICLMIYMSQDTHVVLTPVNLLITFYISLYYSTSVLIALILLIKTNYSANYLVPIIAILLCLGSQLMMVVSPVYGPRNVLCGVIMMSIYFASLIPISINVRFGVKWSTYSNVIVSIGYTTLLVLSIWFMSKTIIGYKTNAVIDKSNMEIVQQYKKNPTGTLTQSKLVLEDFGWSMPYYSKYHEYYYKIFIGVDNDTVIDWK